MTFLCKREACCQEFECKYSHISAIRRNCVRNSPTSVQETSFRPISNSCQKNFTFKGKCCMIAQSGSCSTMVLTKSSAFWTGAQPNGAAYQTVVMLFGFNHLLRSVVCRSMESSPSGGREHPTGANRTSAAKTKVKNTASSDFRLVHTAELSRADGVAGEGLVYTQGQDAQRCWGCAWTCCANKRLLQAVGNPAWLCVVVSTT